MAEPSLTEIRTDRLVLRLCEESERDLFFEVNHDPRLLAFFPFQRSRRDCDAIFDIIREAPSNGGLDFLAIVLRETAVPVGFVALSVPKLEPLLPADAVEIGWRLSARHWGCGYATEAAAGLLAHAFDTLQLDEVFSFTVAGNVRSEAVMRRIGMRHDPSGDFDHPHVPESHPQLRHHVLYRLTAEAWRARS